MLSWKKLLALLIIFCLMIVMGWILWFIIGVVVYWLIRIIYSAYQAIKNNEGW